MTIHKKAAGESGSIAKQSVMPIVAQNDNNAQRIQLTVITGTTPSTLTKKYSLNSAGAMQCQTSANMVAGWTKRLELNSAQEFAEILQKLEPKHALMYGVTEQPETLVYSRKKFEELGKPADAITRTKEHFSWPDGGGVLMLDYDPAQGARPLTQAQLLDTLASVLPELKSSAYVWWCSSSSLIFNDHEQLHGIRGQRVYILVKDARDIERAGKNLFNRLWLAGHGYMMVTRAGTLLERTIIDASVWQTNRLDFAAGAMCSPPLEQRRGAPKVFEGELLDTAAALPDLTEAEIADLAAAKESARDDAQPDVAIARSEYIEVEAEKLLEKTGVDLTEETLEQAKRTIGRALDTGVLAGDFIITLNNGVEVNIGEVLDTPSKYHGLLTLDPLEPEYNGRKVVGRLYLIGGGANLYSQAHGGKNYRLIRQPRKIQHNKGTTAETGRNTLEYLRQLPDVFDMNSQLVVVQDGNARGQNIHSFSYWLGGVAQFYCVKKTPKGELYEEALDPPQQMLNQLLAIGEGRRLKQLEAVITAPVMTKQGRVINRAGYDAKTGLYLDIKEDPLPVPVGITEDQARLALDVLMQPFNGFKTARVIDTSTLLAAVLTAIQRPVFETAPAIGLDAPVQGTGKTYLAECLGMLAIGEKPRVFGHIGGRDDEEARKRITAALLSDGRTLLWDNILGVFDSATMASLLTTGKYTDRILQKSEVTTIKARPLIMLTGNNLTLAGDMPRRVLPIRLDAQVANPATRKFDSNPLDYIKHNRQRLVQAGLTLIRAYLESPECKSGGAVKGESTASFEDWDYMVRQTVAWVAGGIGMFEYEDPLNAISEAVATDPELEVLNEALEGIEKLMGNEWFETRELLKSLDSPEKSPNGKQHAIDLEGFLELGAEVKEMLEDITGVNKLSSRGLGRVLGYRVDRIAGGLKLEKRTGGRVVSFRVVTVDPEQAA